MNGECERCNIPLAPAMAPWPYKSRSLFCYVCGEMVAAVLEHPNPKVLHHFTDAQMEYMQDQERKRALIRGNGGNSSTT